MRLKRGRLYIYCWFGELVDGCCYATPFPLPHYANNAPYHLTHSYISTESHLLLYLSVGNTMLEHNVCCKNEKSLSAVRGQW